METKKLQKRLNIRLEHLIKSKTRIKFHEKLRSRDAIRRVATTKGYKLNCFKEIANYRGQEHFVSFQKIINIDPEPYSIVV